MHKAAKIALIFALIWGQTPHCGYAATRTGYWYAATGGTYYAYPVGVSLTSWIGNRVSLAEGTGSNVGQYSGSLNDATATTWLVFSSGTQPEWGDYIGTIQLKQLTDVVSISGDETSADNLELYTDGTTPAPVNATQLEGLDATNQVRDSIVDDATRIDASDLNSFNDDMEPLIEDIQNHASFLPEITAGSAGGLFIAGTNAATTVTTSFTTTFTGNLTGNVGGNVTGSIGSVATGGLAASSIANNAFTAAKFDPDVTTELQSGLATSVNQATAASALSSILADTNELQTDWANGGRLDNILDARASQTSLDTLTTNVATVDGILDNIFTAFELDTSVYKLTTNALEDAPVGEGDSAATIATAVWEKSLASGFSANQAGKIVFDNLNATVSSRSSHAAADIWNVATRHLTGGNNIVLAKGTGVTGFNDLSAAAVNAEVDTALADYDGPTNAEMVARTLVAANYFDAASDTVNVGLIEGTDATDELGNITSDIDEAAIATAVWGAGTRLLTAGTNIVLAKGTGVTGFNDLSAAQVNAEADTALSDYDGPTNAELATSQAAADDATLAAVAALNNLSSVQAQTAAAAALAAYDPPTHAELTSGLAAADDATLAAIATAQAAINTIDGIVDDILVDTGTTLDGKLNIIDGIIDNMYTAFEADGMVYRITANGLEQAPIGDLDAAGIRDALGMAAADLDDQLDAIVVGGVQPISPDRISNGRTWIATGRRASNIVEVTQGYIGTFSLKPELNPATSILTVDTVTITGAATVTATDLAPTADKLYANFTVPALATTGTYNVAVKVTTTDGQTFTTTATLKVY